MFDWTAEPARPMSVQDVWELMVNGCNAHEVEVAAGVCRATAIGLMTQAAKLPQRAPLTLGEAA